MAVRIVHVVESLEAEAGSVAISLHGLFDALQERGIESQTVTLDRSGKAPGAVHHVTFDPAATTQLVREATVVHLHGWDTAIARSMAGAARKAGKPYVISPLGSLSEGPYNKKRWSAKLRGLLGENKLVRRAAVVTALNTPDRKALQAANLHADIRILPYGINLGDYETADIADANLPAPPEGRCLLLLGPIHPIEGLVRLMKALAEIGTDADGWSGVVAGPETGDWRKMLEAAIRRKGGAGRVLFTSAPNVETQRAWLARASVLAAPSLHFRCPVSIMQAAAAGVPVIASDFAAPDGMNDAIHTCPPTRENLRDALRFILRLSDQERVDMAQKARDVCHSLFDWPVLAKRYIQLYQDLA